MLGNFQDDQMGTKNSVINYILYLIFILVLCIIMLNLLVGIAVGEIAQLLARATVQQISMRILFVLQIQNAIRLTKRMGPLRKLFNMNYNFYNYQLSESSFAKRFDQIIYAFKRKLQKAHPRINLDDPFIKLDEKLDYMFNNFETDTNNSKNELLNRVNFIESRIAISQRRLEDKLNEATRKTMDSFGISKEEDSSSSSSPSDSALNKLERSDEGSMTRQRETFLASRKDSNLDFNSFLVLKLGSLNESFTNAFKALECNLIQQSVHLLNSLNSINQNTNLFRENSLSVKSMENEGFQAMGRNFQSIENKLSVFRAELDFILKKLDSVDTQVKISDLKLNKIKILSENEPFHF